MKGMHSPLEFEGQRVFEFVDSNSISAAATSENQFVEKWDISISSSSSKNKDSTTSSFVGSEPTSVLDTIRSPSPPTSTSTVSSVFGGAGGGGSASIETSGVAAVSGNLSQKWPSLQRDTTTSISNVGAESGYGSLDLHPVAPSLEIGCGNVTAAEKCGLGMEDWDSVLTGTVDSSPSQEQSILGWIVGDVDHPSMGLNKVLQMTGSGELGFGGGFGVAADQAFGLDPVVGHVTCCSGNLMPPMNSSLPASDFSKQINNENFGLPPNPLAILPNYKLPNPHPHIFSSSPDGLPSVSVSPGAFSSGHQSSQLPSTVDSSDLKPQFFNPQMLIGQHHTQHTQSPDVLLPSSYNQQEHHLLMPPQVKKDNPGSLEIPKGLFSDSGQQLFMERQQQQQLPSQGIPHQLQFLSHYLQQGPAANALCNQQQQQQQAIIDQLYNAAELVQKGNPELAQGILARLNHQHSPMGKPFNRAAFYCKEALKLLLHTINSLNSSMAMSISPTSSPSSLIFKIGAYKSFSEISPILHFANFTCNQALLEVLEGFNRIHIVDFDIGFGGQWASLMQELALRSGGTPSLKVTAFASPSTADQLELGLTRENFIHFASEINMEFEFEIICIDSLNSASWSLPLHVSENEAIAVNLPVGSFFNYQLPLPLVLRLVKQLSPKIVVSIDRGCDRTDLSFPSHVIQVLQSFSNLLDSLEAVNVNLETLQKIERILLQPGIEKIIMGRYRSPEKTQHWRTVFLSFGFFPFTFSNFTEAQAEYVVKRTPVRGFNVEKRQSSLVLCWQRKVLISASAWKC